MAKRAPSAQASGAARLENYMLVINKLGRDGSGKANIVCNPGSYVMGVLYEIEEADLSTLDIAESGYHRDQINVVTSDGIHRTAWVYISQSAAEGLRPRCWYLSYLVKGAMENNLPEDYIEALRNIDCSGDTSHL